jgi:hypothetical protein|tara:strand:+ start:2517 stop:2720 length:204 start_codon:yes stop_codon:yes gene_type:complete
MSKFKHYDIFTREVVFEDEEADFGKVMREQSKSLIVVGGSKRKSNFPETHWAATSYDDRRALPGYRY